MTTRRSVAIALGGAAALVAVTSVWWFASRDSDTDASGSNGRAVSFTITWDYSEIVTDCTPGAPRVCLNRFAVPATAALSGDVTGVGAQVVLWNEPADYPNQGVDHIEHVVTYNVDAAIEGCGDGRFMLLETPQFVSGDDHDRVTGTYAGAWQIVAQSGHGELEAMTGSGTSAGVFGTAADDGRTFTGTIDCG